MNGPLEMVGDDETAQVCLEGVCAVPGTTSAPSGSGAEDGADDA